MNFHRFFFAPTLIVTAILPPFCAAHAADAATSSETLPDNPVLLERHETPAEHDRRMAWFRDARFGMFIHFGLYAQAGGVWKGRSTNVNGCCEWLMCGGRVSIAEYAALAKDFNPVHYDAEKWVLAAQAAGMKYMVITAKHHEGFAMFKTAASPFNIVDATPFHRDPLKELAAACHKHGMKLGFYYSQNLDWHHPGGGSGGWDPAHKGDPEKYVDEIAIPQIKEILTNYGEISVLWWDIPGGVIDKARADRIEKLVLKCNPNIILNNRLGGGYHGDTETPEQFIPPNGFPGRDWESCMTMNKTWGYSKLDHNWKSTTTLRHNLCDIASKGGNYLLNVGPNELGEIPAPSLERLSALGAWLKIHGEAIYGTRASIFDKTPAWGRTTTRRLPKGDTRLYAIVFDSPKDGVISFPGLCNTILNAEIIGGKAVKFSSDGQSASVSVPENQRDAKDFVVAIDLQGAPVVDTAVHADENGVFTLSPRDASATHGIRVEAPGSAGLKSSGEEHLGYWTDKRGTIAWTVRSSKEQTVAVMIRLSAEAASVGSKIELACGNQALPLEMKSTGGWENFSDASAGILKLPVGIATITLRAKSVKGIAPCNVASIKLTPVP